MKKLHEKINLAISDLQSAENDLISAEQIDDPKERFLAKRAAARCLDAARSIVFEIQSEVQADMLK